MISRNFKVDPVSPPTEKQRLFAAAISEVVGKPPPKVKTLQSMFLFIRDNIDDYKATLDAMDRDNDDEAWDFLRCAGYDPYTGGLGD